MRSDSDLADEVIARLNALIQDPNICVDIEKLINVRIGVSEQTIAHPTIQVAAESDTLGFLGLLNGIVGTISEGRLKGWGYIAAVYDDANHLTGFRRTDAEP